MFDNKYDDILDENGHAVSVLDDDYDYYIYLQDAETDPLSDDYVKDG